MRDFRDAKAMAHALRNGLKAKAVETTHSECLELLAKAFGCESWNVLSAKIEATYSPEPDRQAHDPRFKEVLSCSFCGKTQHEVKELVAGPSVFVCDEFLANLIPKPAKPEPNRISNELRPRPYGLFLDDLPIHIRPDLPAARVQT